MICKYYTDDSNMDVRFDNDFLLQRNARCSESHCREGASKSLTISLAMSKPATLGTNAVDATSGRPYSSCAGSMCASGVSVE